MAKRIGKRQKIIKSDVSDNPQKNFGDLKAPLTQRFIVKYSTIKTATNKKANNCDGS